MDITNEWPTAVWQEINDGVVKEVNKIRMAQKVYPPMIFTNSPSQIPDEKIDFAKLSIKEGDTKPLVEIYAEFSLTTTQVKNEAEQKTCRTLARMAAKVLALAEDAYFFQVSDRNPECRDLDPTKLKVRLPGNVGIDNWRKNLDFGLLAEANPPDADDYKIDKVTKPIHVASLPANSSAKWGENTFNAVSAGISKLVAKGQAPNYALFLPTEVYADTSVLVNNVTIKDRVLLLVEGGLYSSGVLPEDEGLLVALGGEPVKLYLGQEAVTTCFCQEGGRFFFRVTERVQYVVRDPRALVLLKFDEPAAARKVSPK